MSNASKINNVTADSIPQTRTLVEIPTEMLHNNASIEVAKTASPIPNPTTRALPLPVLPDQTTRAAKTCAPMLSSMERNGSRPKDWPRVPVLYANRKSFHYRLLKAAFKLDSSDVMFGKRPALLAGKRRKKVVIKSLGRSGLGRKIAEQLPNSKRLRVWLSRKRSE